MKLGTRFFIHLVGIVLYAACGWIAGLVLIPIVAMKLGRWLLRLRRALSPTIPCPWCHASVDQYGPFVCLGCRARTLGWAWRCSACKAWAGHLECPACRLTVSNPLLGAP
jgi:hypothetical protein